MLHIYISVNRETNLLFIFSEIGNFQHHNICKHIIDIQLPFEISLSQIIRKKKKERKRNRNVDYCGSGL